MKQTLHFTFNSCFLHSLMEYPLSGQYNYAFTFNLWPCLTLCQHTLSCLVTSRPGGSGCPLAALVTDGISFACPHYILQCRSSVSPKYTLRLPQDYPSLRQFLQRRGVSQGHHKCSWTLPECQRHAWETALCWESSAAGLDGASSRGPRARMRKSPWYHTSCSNSAHVCRQRDRCLQEGATRVKGGPPARPCTQRRETRFLLGPKSFQLHLINTLIMSCWFRLFIYPFIIFIFIYYDISDP